MNTILCVAAKGIIRDAVDNTISIFSILEGISAEGFPVLIQQMGVLAIWMAEEGEEEVDLEFLAQLNDDELLRQPFQIRFRDGNLHRHVINLNAVMVQHPGTLTFRFLRGNDEVCAYSIEVRGAPPRVEEREA